MSIRVAVRFRPRRQEDRPFTLGDGATGADLLAAAGEPAHATVIVRAGQPVPESTPLLDGDEILLLSAASGG